MTAAERQARRRERVGKSINRRRRTLRKLKNASAALKAQREQRAARERELGERIRFENDRLLREGKAMTPVTRPDGSQIVGWLAGLPIIATPAKRQRSRHGGGGG
jgi:hypothetical protein